MVELAFNPSLSPFHATAAWLLSVGVPYTKVLQHFYDSIDYWYRDEDIFRKDKGLIVNGL